MLLLSLPLAHFCHDFWSSNASLQLARSVSRSILWWVVLWGRDGMIHNKYVIIATGNWSSYLGYLCGLWSEMTVSKRSIAPRGLCLFAVSEAAWMTPADSLDKMRRNFISNEPWRCWAPSCSGRWDWESCGLVAECGGCRSGALTLKALTCKALRNGSFLHLKSSTQPHGILLILIWMCLSSPSVQE